MNRSPLAFDLPAFLRARMPLLQPNETRDAPNGEKVPLPNGLNGRGTQGRFSHGNTGGPGNPFNRQIAAFRRAVCAAVTEEDLGQLTGVLLDKARAGDLAALKLLFQYAVGKPTDAVDPDKLDIQELQLHLQTAATPQALAAIFSQLPAQTACDLVRHVLPILGKAMATELVNELQRDPDDDDDDDDDDDVEELLGPA